MTEQRRFNPNNGRPQVKRLGFWVDDVRRTETPTRPLPGITPQIEFPMRPAEDPGFLFDYDSRRRRWFDSRSRLPRWLQRGHRSADDPKRRG